MTAKIMRCACCVLKYGPPKLTVLRLISLETNPKKGTQLNKDT